MGRQETATVGALKKLGETYVEGREGGRGEREREGGGEGREGGTEGWGREQGREGGS